jgi:hypothetical protein
MINEVSINGSVAKNGVQADLEHFRKALEWAKGQQKLTGADLRVLIEYYEDQIGRLMAIS